jgi:hypothetical protein
VCHTFALLALCACTLNDAHPRVFRTHMLGLGGGERYSAWFADERDGVIYFGLSPFWSEMRAHGGDPAADMLEPSAHAIGRFDTERDEFLAPLIARKPGDDSHSSVWDVLAHPNGWIYYTTYFEEMGRVRPGFGQAEHFDDLGPGLNEIALGPDQNLYVTRYGAGRNDGGVAVISPEGLRVREVALHARSGGQTAPKSIAVDPHSGDVWVNADVVAPDKSVSFAAFHLAPDLHVLERLDPALELQFMAFDATGRGFFVEDRAGRLELRVTRDGAELLRVDLGPRAPHDFAQDIHFAPDGTAAIVFWSGRVDLVRQHDGNFEHAEIQLERPEQCTGEGENALFYSAFVIRGSVYATLYCDAAIVRAPLPGQFQTRP